MAEYECSIGIQQSLVAGDLQLCAELPSLVAIKNAQGDAYARTEGIEVEGIVERRIPRIPGGDDRVSAAVGPSEAMIRFGFLHRLHGGFEVRPGVERDLAKLVQRSDLIRKIVGSRDIKLLNRSPII